MRWRADEFVVEGCNAGSSISNWYPVAVFSIISKPIGSFAFANWDHLDNFGPALRTQLNALDKLCDLQETTKAVLFFVIGDRRSSAEMDSAPLFLQEPHKEYSTESGCTWRSLCSALAVAEPLLPKSKLRAGSRRLKTALSKLCEPSSMEQFAERVTAVKKTGISLTHMSCDFLASPKYPDRLRKRILREQA